MTQRITTIVALLLLSPWLYAGDLSGGPDPAPKVAAVKPPQPPVAKATPRPTMQTVVVPPFNHAHRRIDGTVYYHHDSNHGNAAAHAGTMWPWPKIATAGQTVVIPR